MMPNVRLPKSSWLGAPAAGRGLDGSTLQAWLRQQFANLDPNDPSRWPILPRMLLLLLAGIAVLAALWYAWLSDLGAELEHARRQEAELRARIVEKMAQATSLEELKGQLEQVRQFVVELEKQLPSRAEMDALLSDINQAGVGRGLQFELFRPGGEVVRDHYAELSITLRVTGSFEQIGWFVADVAQLPRIVTLSDLSLAPAQHRSDQLTMEATAKTYRYLDPEESLSRQKNQNREAGKS